MVNTHVFNNITDDLNHNESFLLSFTAERQCQTGLTCTNGGCVRIPSNGSEVCECNSGYELSDSDSTLCIGKCHVTFG